MSTKDEASPVEGVVMPEKYNDEVSALLWKQDEPKEHGLQELNRVLRDHRDMYSGQVTAVVYLGDQTAFEFGMPKKITLVLRHDGTFQVERHTAELSRVAAKEQNHE